MAAALWGDLVLLPALLKLFWKQPIDETSHGNAVLA